MRVARFEVCSSMVAMSYRVCAKGLDDTVAPAPSRSHPASDFGRSHQVKLHRLRWMLPIDQGIRGCLGEKKIPRILLALSTKL